MMMTCLQDEMWNYHKRWDIRDLLPCSNGSARSGYGQGQPDIENDFWLDGKFPKVDTHKKIGGEGRRGRIPN